ncbi:VOC family protein [Rhodococcus wratislaviensis]|uniref:Putative extradiol dioxygenase n=1 Tax=Rhodococcus wratislaviensis NBRC 100605 TaxID=1219028 RepID=X0PMB3_RHOWR|nr:VOC family protein [Rhodococcus wratislaviensis]GAF43588.1 putative extradiol dioxygenase [Rhodococcus wratislaviensis NBRC 100605]
MTATQPTPTGPVPTHATEEKGILHHIGFRVTRDEFQPAIDWYRNALDMEVNFQGHFHDLEVCFLVNDRANHRVVFQTHASFERDPDYARRARLEHSAFEFETIDGLLARYARLRDQGYHPYLSIDHGLTLSIYYLDPIGHGLELQCDAFGDWDESKEWMRAAAEFVANPAGILFDPDQVIEARNAGADLDELHKRIYDDGEFPPRPDQRTRLSLVSSVTPNVWDHPSWGSDHPTFGPA